MNTFGDFYDAVLKRTEEGEHPMFDSKAHIEDWVNGSGPYTATHGMEPDQWEEVRAMELTEGLVVRFAEDMLTAMQKRIAHICTEEMYEIAGEEARTFRKMISDVAVEFGFHIESTCSQPLTPTEALQRYTDPNRN